MGPVVIECNWGHTDIKLCVTFLAPNEGPVVCVLHFWYPMWGSKVLGGMGNKEVLLSGLKSTTSVKEMFNHISL